MWKVFWFPTYITQCKNLTFNNVLVDDLLVFPNEFRFEVNSMDDSHLFQKRWLSRLPRTQQQKFHLKKNKINVNIFLFVKIQGKEISIKVAAENSIIRFTSLHLFSSAVQVILMTCNFQVEIGEEAFGSFVHSFCGVSIYLQPTTSNQQAIWKVVGCKTSKSFKLFN